MEVGPACVARQKVPIVDMNASESRYTAREGDRFRTAVRLDARLPMAHAQLGWVFFWKHQLDAAVAEFERAFALNPNFIDNRFANVLICVGEPARAI